MTDNCILCGKFVPDYNDGNDHCKRCIAELDAELNEAEAGIGQGSTTKPDKEYCRHCIARRIYYKKYVLYSNTYITLYSIL
jgi:hypothetical protein